MSAGAVAIRITADPRPALRQLGRVASMLAQVVAESTHREGQRAALAHYATGKVLSKLDPCVDVQVVTTNEGRCRVVVRRLGGWS